MPEEALRSCALAVLRSQATYADLEAAYAERGGQIVRCDAARRLALDTLEAERALVERWLRARRS
ncbi:hypothetical protein E4M02_10770 [Brevundimonas sp. S30B]|nr:hypothetical protein E4M01_13030 [Brevundimonas sp. MF30-B]TFW01398.1 hypothetical protein E4M02_10770 [Brevundimonas sp. S30B]